MSNNTTKTFNQVALLILDGWGYREEKEYNAIAQAPAAYMDYLWKTYPHTLFQASGEAVGLPQGIIGTSEIGHMTIGVGRVIYTDMLRVGKAIEDRELRNNQAITTLFAHVRENNSTLHFMGLVSPGGVHSYQDHLFAFLKQAKEAGIAKMMVHVFTDGRDMPPRSAVAYIKKLQGILSELGVGRIATISGRYFAMDRDTNWDRIQKAVDAIFSGQGQIYEGKSAVEIIEEQYKKDVGDEFIEPCVLLNEDGKADVISQNDGVFFFNFRPDRAREISAKVLEKSSAMNLCFVTLTEYDKNLKSLVAFPPVKIETSLAAEISKAGLTQVHIAETEKYAHITYFLNGGEEKPHENEEYVMVNTRKDVPTHDLAPHMRAQEIADKAIEFIEKGTNFVALNFANADMVGHTGKWEPALEAVRFEDAQIKRVVEAILAKGGVAFITADHGNAELLFDAKTNQPHTAHTLNPVPGILTEEGVSLESGGLADVAPTVLGLFGIAKPEGMSGSNIVHL